jgi:paraquat-inducible protein A
MTDGAAGELIACHECDRLHVRETVPEGARADCARCGAMLYRHVPHSLDRALAFHLATLLALIVANVYPFMSMKAGGAEHSMHLVDAGLALAREGMPELGVLVFLTSVAFPLLTVGSMLWLLIPARLGAVPPLFGPAYRIVRALDPWSMLGVFFLGTLIAVFKLLDLADVVPETGVLAFVAALFLFAAGRAAFAPEALLDGLPQRSPRPEEVDADAVLLNCHGCGLLVREGPGVHGCPRCGAHLHRRAGDSIHRTWALLVTATLLMIPAQLYPVMTISQLGRGDPSTIIGGVQLLVHHGLYGLAFIVFFASVVVPAAKLIALAFLLRSVQTRSRWRPRDRTFLYRVVEVIGAWSMIDVFLVAVFAGLVRLGVLANVTPEIGASFFGAVVVVTMFASHSFDPRLIWDHADENGERAGVPVRPGEVAA